MLHRLSVKQEFGCGPQISYTLEWAYGIGGWVFVLQVLEDSPS